MNINHLWQKAPGVLLALLLAACGGGGSGDAAPQTRQALPALVQDIEPAGARVDLRAQNYFPSSQGDNWVYSRIENGISTPNAVTRSISSVSGNEFVLSESDSTGTGFSTYRCTSAGLVMANFLGSGVPAAAVAQVGDILEYAEPFYSVGSTRRMIRQGSWGEDLDGDGIAESFRLEYTQTFVGQPNLTLPDGTSTTTAEFLSSAIITLTPSSLKNQPISVTATEHAWWAPGIGLVRVERASSASDGQTIVPAHALVLSGGVVNGQTLFASSGGTGSGNLAKLTLTHNGLVFDPLRGRYYASIPGSVVGQGNSIAIIDASTKQVSYSAAVGSEPGPLAISADGSTLYVGLNGSGDVLRLRLPDMLELGRTRLPVTSFYGQLYAENLSVSPTDANVVAVSMLRLSVSPRHGGVALIRSDVLQPVMTQEHTGSNLIVFDANGQYVYGYNNESTEFGLRRIAVQTDGLVQQAVITANANFGTRTIDWSAQGIVLERSVYRAPDLAMLGTASTDVAGCRAHTVPNRLICSYGSFGSSTGQLAVVDASTFVIKSVPVYQASAPAPDQIVPGAAGQVALRFGNTYYNSSATQIWLFNSTDLQ
ncbi:MAG: YncE family protein [Leptothrix sp. (in: b-proteobacteria)]